MFTCRQSIVAGDDSFLGVFQDQVGLLHGYSFGYIGFFKASVQFKSYSAVDGCKFFKPDPMSAMWSGMFQFGSFFNVFKRDSRCVIASGLPKETVTAIMMLYMNMKAMVRSLDGDTDFFHNVAGVFQQFH